MTINYSIDPSIACSIAEWMNHLQVLFTITCTITPAVNLPVSGFCTQVQAKSGLYNYICTIYSTCSSTKPAMGTGTGLISLQGPRLTLSLRRTLAAEIRHLNEYQLYCFAAARWAALAALLLCQVSIHNSHPTRDTARQLHWEKQGRGVQTTGFVSGLLQQTQLTYCEGT